MIDGPDGAARTRTLSVTLDLTPAAGYNGSTRFGTVTWADGKLGELGSHTFTGDVNFGAILLGEANTSTGAFTALTLRQIVPSSMPATFASWIRGFGLQTADQDFSDDPDGDRLPNGVEAWFGTNPGGFNPEITGLTTLGAGFCFTHPRSDTPPDGVIGSYEWSSNLVDWYPSGSGPLGGPTVTMVAETSAGIATVTATASTALDHLFLRVKVIAI